MSYTQLLRADQVAEILNVQTSTVYEWARMSYIPHVRIGIGEKKPCIRFSRNAVEAWLKEKEKQGRTSRIPPEQLN